MEGERLWINSDFFKELYGFLMYFRLYSFIETAGRCILKMCRAHASETHP